MELITAKEKLKIGKPIEEVFSAVVDCEKICKYFTVTASANMVEGTTVQWSWSDAGAAFDIKVLKIEENTRVVFVWPATSGETTVELTFKSIDANSTQINVVESGWELSISGADKAAGQVGGWMHMFLCMKAYLEFGINLRAGSVQNAFHCVHLSIRLQFT